MRVARLSMVLLILLITTGNAPSAFAKPSAGTTEVYTLAHVIRGEKVTQTVYLFPESPFENPNLVSQIRKLPLDHVVFAEADDGDPGRAPSDASDYDQGKARVESQGQKPVETVKVKRGIFRNIRDNWARAFPKIDRNDPDAVAKHRGAIRYALISTASKVGTYMVMLITDPRFAFDVAAAMVLTQGLFVFINNAFNENISRFAASSVLRPGEQAGAINFFNRKLSYLLIVSQLYKLAEVGSKLFTTAVQLTVWSNTIMYGVGDTWLSNVLYKKFAGQKHKIDKLNFWVGSISGLFISLDLMKHRLMPVLFDVGKYEFRVSGAILIAYYTSVLIWANRNPEGMYNAAVALENSLAKIKNILPDCDFIFRGKDLPPPSLPK